MHSTLRATAIAALLCASFFPNPAKAAGATVCDQISVTLITSKTTTKVISLASGQAIYICGSKVFFHQGAVASATVDIEYGTQTTTPCDTGTVDITGVVSIGNLSNSIALPKDVIPLQQPSLYTTAISQDLCVITGGTTDTGIDILVFYAQHA